MTDESNRPEPSPGRAVFGRRFKPRKVELADGGSLALDVDGSIRRLDDQGKSTQTWTPEDPEWPREAIRFGLQSQAPTVAPHGRVPGTKPPRR